MKRILIAALSVTALFAFAAPMASAGMMDQFKAADEAERVADRRYHINSISTCRQIGSKTFTCDIMDFKGSCSWDGRATVRKVSSYTFRVKSMRVTKDCY